MGFGRELSVRPSVRVSELVELLSSRGGSTGSPSARLSVRLSSRRSLAERPKSHAEVRTGVGFYRFSGGQLPNFQGKST